MEGRRFLMGEVWRAGALCVLLALARTLAAALVSAIVENLFFVAGSILLFVNETEE